MKRKMKAPSVLIFALLLLNSCATRYTRHDVEIAKDLKYEILTDLTDEQLKLSIMEMRLSKYLETGDNSSAASEWELTLEQKKKVEALQQKVHESEKEIIHMEENCCEKE